MTLVTSRWQPAMRATWWCFPLVMSCKITEALLPHSKSILHPVISLLAQLSPNLSISWEAINVPSQIALRLVWECEIYNYTMQVLSSTIVFKHASGRQWYWIVSPWWQCRNMLRNLPLLRGSLVADESVFNSMPHFISRCFSLWLHGTFHFFKIKIKGEQISRIL